MTIEEFNNLKINDILYIIDGLNIRILQCTIIDSYSVHVFGELYSEYLVSNECGQYTIQKDSLVFKSESKAISYCLTMTEYRSKLKELYGSKYPELFI